MDRMKKKSLLELKRMKLKEVEQYYLELRKYEYENNVPLRGIELRKKIHNILLSLIKIDRLLSGEELYVINDRRERDKKGNLMTGTPKIYACTHIGGHDVERVFEAIEEHAYLFIGDLKELYTDAMGLVLDANGAIKLDTSDKTDRHIAYQRSIELLNKGGNILIFPEGVWNVSPNKPVLYLYPGTLKMANETHADIIPVAIEQYANRFFVSIGKEIHYDKDKSSNIPLMTETLRDAMATLKWDIWSTVGISTRKSITEDEINGFQERIIKRCDYDFSAAELERTLYWPHEITQPEEVYIISPLMLYALSCGNFDILKDEKMRDGKPHIMLPKNISLPTIHR